MSHHTGRMVGRDHPEAERAIRGTLAANPGCLVLPSAGTSRVSRQASNMISDYSPTTVSGAGLVAGEPVQPGKIEACAGYHIDHCLGRFVT